MTVPSNAVQSNGVGAVSDEQLNTFVQTDQTATQLRSFVGITGMGVMLQGIASQGDGFAGLFYWKNGTGFVDDNDNVIVPPAAIGKGAWLRAGISGPAPFLPLAGGVITGNLEVEGTTTLDGTVSGTGITSLFSSPPALGDVTPGAVHASTLSASGAVSGNGFSDLVAAGTNVETEQTRLVGTAISLTTNTPADVLSMNITPGKWWVYGNVVIQSAGGGAASTTRVWLSTTSATLPTLPGAGGMSVNQFTTSANGAQCVPVGRYFDVAVLTTIYISTSVIFTNTATAYGFLGAIPLTLRAHS